MALAMGVCHEKVHVFCYIRAYFKSVFLLYFYGGISYREARRFILENCQKVSSFFS